MQCLHCGKKLSLLRKLSDGRFCCDEHREEYERLESDLALARLLGARKAHAAHGMQGSDRRRTGPAVAVVPMAPLLPESLRVADWRRVAGPPLRLIGFQAVLAMPESPLRPRVRGFPEARPAAWVSPLGGRKPALAASFLRPAFVPPDSPPSPWPRPQSSPVPEINAPAPPPMAGLLRLSLTPPVAETHPVCGIPAAPLLRRRKLVVILPGHPARPQTGGLRQAAPEAVGLALAAPGPHRVRWLEGRAAIPESAPTLPALSVVIRRRSAARQVRAETAEPPLYGVQQSLPPANPLNIPPPRLHAPPGLALGDRGPWFPAIHGRTPPAMAPQAAAMVPFHPAAVSCTSTSHRAKAEPGWQRLDPCLPAISNPAPRKRWSPAWPKEAGLVSPNVVLCKPAASTARTAWEPLVAAWPDPCLPALDISLPGRNLRPAWRPERLDAAAAAEVAPVIRFASPQPTCGELLPEIPPSRLELMPPEPAQAEEPLLAEEARAASALVAAPEAALHGAALTSNTDREQAGACQELARETGEPAPVFTPAATAADETPVPAMARRLPEMPIRPVCQELAGASPPLPSTAAPCWPSLEEPHPSIPRLRFELDHADGSGPQRKSAPARQGRPRRKTAVAGAGRRFWSHAPSDLKWIAVVLPLLLLVVVYSFRSKTPNHPPERPEMAATRTAPANPPVQETALNTLQRLIQRRAAIRLFDDFRSGLAMWEGRDGWSKSWRYGDATFIEPGELALLTPSLSMTDYTLTFLGQIERRSLNWVFRAKDLSNYYSMRIVITRGGPLPEAAVVRSAVINGREQDVRTMPIPFPVRADTLYLVRMEVRGQDFTTYIQNQVVDHFSDSRLKQGGVGFFSPKGDRALLRWVEVSHQYDYLGRLCALLAPYGVQNFANN